MIRLFTLIEIGILIALAIIITGAIAVLIARIRKDQGSSGPDTTGLQALLDLQTKVAEVTKNGSASTADCTELRRLLQLARSHGVPDLTTDSMRTKINGFCD